MVYVVAYDLKSPHDSGDDYDRVIGAIKAFADTWCHVEKSVWLIASESTASEVRDELKKSLYSTDVLFVGKLSGNWASYNAGPKRAEWLKNRMF